MPIIVTQSGSNLAASTIIKRAMRLLGVLPSGGTPTTDEYADALEALNALLDSWRNEKLMCYAFRDESITPVASQSNYTIGDTGDLATNRPVAIESAYVISSAVSYPITMRNELEYAAITSKASTADIPTDAYYNPTMPNGTLWVWPVPTLTTPTIHIITRTPMLAFSTTATTAQLPPGWEEAMATNLAISIAPEYEREPSATVRKMAMESKANIKRINARPLKSFSELGVLLGRSHTTILNGP